jgi:uridine kinase
MDPRPVLDLIAASANGAELVLVGIGGHGGFEIERLAREVVEPLVRGETAQFASFDWDARAPGASRTVAPHGIVIVEGVCALHRSLRDAYAVRVWVDAPYDLRLERGVARDGEVARSTWVEMWMPSEERYVERDDPIPSAHLIVDGSGTV